MAVRVCRHKRAAFTCARVALERSATWLREAQQWLGEPLDVVAVHLDYDDREGAPYYELKLLCNEEDLAGAPIAKRDLDADGSS